MSSTKQQTGLVVSAHSADFVWRAGGDSGAAVRAC